MPGVPRQCGCPCHDSSPHPSPAPASSPHTKYCYARHTKISVADCTSLCGTGRDPARAMGREAELIEAAREGNYPQVTNENTAAGHVTTILTSDWLTSDCPQVERILSTKPKKAGPFASLRRAQGGICSRDSRGGTQYLV